MADRDPRTVVLKDVRLSFPHIFKPQTQKNDDGSERQSYNCVLMVPKDHPRLKQIVDAVKTSANAARAKAWGDDESKWPKIPASMTCWKDGDKEDQFQTPREEYEGHYVLSASAPVDRPPSVITNRKGADDLWIAAEPGQKGAPYAGCYVNAVVELYGQKKNSERKIPNRINASVSVVQFLRDGEAFGRAPVDPNDYFDDDDVGYSADLDDEDDGLI